MAPTEENFYRFLGERIAQFRRGQRLTQERLAATAGISRSSLANIEKGRQLVGVHLLVKFAQTLGLPVGDLIPLEIKAFSTADIEQKLAELQENERAWVMKVIDVSLTEGTNDETTVRAGPKKGGGIAQQGLRSGTPRTG